MVVNITGRKMEISQALKERIEKKLAKLDKYFNEDTIARVTVMVEGMRHTMEVTINHKGMVFRAQSTTNDLYNSLDTVIDALERQIRKNKTRLEKRLKAGAFEDTSDFTELDLVEDDYTLVKSKKFAIKPMDIEEAILNMNLLGHEFYVFRNGSSDEVNVVYRRKNGGYGLIEPE